MNESSNYFSLCTICIHFDIIVLQVGYGAQTLQWFHLTTISTVHYSEPLQKLMSNVPEVPPYQAVLEAPQALGLPVEGRRYINYKIDLSAQGCDLILNRIFHFLIGRVDILTRQAFLFVTLLQHYLAALTVYPAISYKFGFGLCSLLPAHNTHCN